MANRLTDPRRILLKVRTTKRWWLPLSLIAAVLVGGLAMMMPKTYESTSLVLIHQPPLASDNQTLRVGDVLSTIRERINSFTFLQEVANRCNLDAGISPDSPEFAKLINRMRKSISLAVYSDNFRLTYTGYTPQEAYEASNAIVNLFIAQSAQFYNERANSNVTFLKSQLAEAQRKMVDAQAKVREYKDAHLDELPEAQEQKLATLTKARQEADTTEQDLQATEDALKMAQRRLETTSPTLSTETAQVENPELAALRKQDRDLKMQLDTMINVQGYTEEHWAVKAARRQLTMLDDQISSLTAQVTKTVSSEPNPAYTALQNMVTDLQLKEAGLKKRRIEQQRQIEALANELKTKPQAEDELRTLNRDYQMAVNLVDSYSSQLAQANRTAEMEASGMGPSYEIKDPPRLPTSPSGKRTLKAAVATVAAGGGTLALIVMLFVLMDSSVRSVEEAREILQMPVLGIVQRILSPSQQRLARRRKLRRVAMACVLLAVIAAGATYGYTHYHDEIVLRVLDFREYLKRQ